MSLAQREVYKEQLPVPNFTVSLLDRILDTVADASLEAFTISMIVTSIRS